MSKAQRMDAAPEAALDLTWNERALALGAAAALTASVLGALVEGGGVFGVMLLAVLALALAADRKLTPWPAGISVNLITGAVGVGAGLLAVGLLLALPGGGIKTSFWMGVVALWLSAWFVSERLSRRGARPGRAVRIAAPAIFGVTLLLLWELVTRGGGVSTVILPPPSMIADEIVASADVLWVDIQQTIFRSVFAGYAIGCGAGFLVALLIERSDFLKRGVLPIGNLFSALPIIAVAPIMVLWFGVEWHSKAAVVVLMTFFPMLVNTVAGLDAADRMQRDLMRTYAAGYVTSLWKLRLPAASPFIFNALKINTTLALIGAIVAEFFPGVQDGIGARIRAAVGNSELDLVWAEIAAAAVAGVAFYGAVALIERAATFWHPSMRK